MSSGRTRGFAVSSFIFLSVNRSSLEYPRAVFVVLFCSVGDPSLPEPAPGTHRGLPYGKQSAGRGNKACVNSIVPAALLHQKKQRKEREGEAEGGRKGGGGCASVWLNGENAMC